MKILFITEHPVFGKYNYEVFSPIWDNPRYEIVGVIINPRQKKPLKEMIKTSFRKKRGGYMMIMAFGLFWRKVKNCFQKNRDAAALYNIRLELGEKKGLPITHFEKLYTPEALCFIQSLNADLAILFGYHKIVRKTLIDLFPRGILSFHYGDMRKYRGQPPGYWELYFGEKFAGITVQCIGAGVDCGIPICEKQVPVFLSDTLKTLNDRQLRVSEDMMVIAVERIYQADSKFKTLDNYGKVYSFPGFFQHIYFLLKMLPRNIRALFSKTSAKITVY